VAPGLGDWLRQKAGLISDLASREEPGGDGGLGTVMGYEPQLLVDKLESKLKASANSLLERAGHELNAKRAELLTAVVHKVEDVLGIKKIVPANVYENEGVVSNVFEQIKSDIGFTVVPGLLGAGRL
jgi:hypothetical protein